MKPQKSFWNLWNNGKRWQINKNATYGCGKGTIMNTIKKATLLLSCLLFALTGCNEAESTDIIPTEQPTAKITEAAAPTTEPTIAPSGPVVSGPNVEIESIQIQDEHTILVTLKADGNVEKTVIGSVP